jgi:hypothetical protein
VVAQAVAQKGLIFLFVFLHASIHGHSNASRNVKFCHRFQTYSRMYSYTLIKVSAQTARTLVFYALKICMPPFEEEGVYCFAHVGLSVCRYVGLSVGPSTRWFPDDNSRTLRSRIMKLHRYIDHDWQMTPIDFQVARSKVKVTVTQPSKMVSG